MASTVEEEIRGLIAQHGRISFARFMGLCLYSPHGGFYATRSERISAHFGTAPMSHPAFGTLIARQLEQMWHLLDEPPNFHVIEPGSGDGALSRAVAAAAASMDPRFARALYYVASDLTPLWLHSEGHAPTVAQSDPGAVRIQRVKAAGVSAFENATGCILVNELVDNFPVHRYVIEQGRVRELFVTVRDGDLVEAPGDPSTPRIEEYLRSIDAPLGEGDRGEVCLAADDWSGELARALTRGFVLTIDYGELAGALRSPAHRSGTLMCYHRHEAGADPYRHLGEQDITCLVDFTALMHCGARRGLAVLGYATQRAFLGRLGFDSLLADTASGARSAAHAELERMAMMALVDPEQYGDFKVLVQGKGMPGTARLLGFADPPT